MLVTSHLPLVRPLASASLPRKFPKAESASAAFRGRKFSYGTTASFGDAGEADWSPFNVGLWAHETDTENKIKIKPAYRTEHFLSITSSKGKSHLSRGPAGQSKLPFISFKARAKALYCLTAPA
jgi:hypothetical protein